MEELEMQVEQIEQFIESKDNEGLQAYLNELNISDVEALIDELPEYGHIFIETLNLNRAVNVFRILDFPTQERIFKKLSGAKISELINEMPPDDRTSFFSELKDGDVVKQLIILLPPQDRKEALSLLGYPEDSVGRLMTPDYITVKPHWNIIRILEHIRRYGKNSETIDVLYVIDAAGKLIDDIRIKDVLMADPNVVVGDLIDNRLISLHANDPQEEAVNIFRMNNRVALPVVDEQGIMLGIVTIDDILWVANEEYTEDMQRFGGTEALDEPYLDVSIVNLVKKRSGWLVVLFFGQLLTATVIEHFEHQLASAIMLFALMPLIISSGGNSGSQASTLIIQAMALGEITIGDWWRVMKREIVSGFLLGLILGILGFIRIMTFQGFSDAYGEHWVLVGLVVGFSLVGVVLWGSLMGSMLPFILRKLGADPASSSAPFVSTLVDVTGLLIYFTFAVLLLKGVLI
ncbi:MULTISPECIES: magnesium transporter [Sphingobacterium]|jgi:magnesium transporter|uniref:Magnesium transporter MgtE n=2 Tax=Sphingobacterium TaxID=28453 RepID=A0ABW5Z2T9_9SPHI|nr:MULTISPECIES: magnesium transporter [Sphingobacterium]MBB2952418.1 magnesium transporter [Sphingobacterium sp. JUb56]MCS3557343.1 magnesium transporter [Sphingobacterium sp. JUb21]MCW2260876.1 magnesium transporter [Sphingobacterium kitahiroshimense]NJI76469.1 magnesium transporter [Sphingobacterium sp. B16(2022)]QQD14429.1 magnesium transporter [Sphingobacterium sp. UDSM-2020]